MLLYLSSSTDTSSPVEKQDIVPWSWRVRRDWNLTMMPPKARRYLSSPNTTTTTNAVYELHIGSFSLSVCRGTFHLFMSTANGFSTGLERERKGAQKRWNKYIPCLDNEQLGD
jgi:hypothetical protein